ncbi:DNA repair endonuclease XPF-like isoform X1 [Diachasmimorpha longicaudata]|uniref:DNA repair endonuclease XPF-like isoform X1 n=1 Tax=Diachasmimorpha longicaudata TaxID=58733 RepID=UPI0030B88690
MLEYEKQMFLEVLQDDGLLISAKGLGLEIVFTNILKVYSDPGNLVIVLGMTDHDENFFMDKLKEMNVKPLPKIMSAQSSSAEREILYLEGGIVFISGRIFVVDMLKHRVPLNLVTGILVWRAHAIMNSYQDAFCLRLYRQNNKTGFIKAFSKSVLAFTAGSAPVERLMKTLFVKHLFLWPRFHTTVTTSLSVCKPEVIELHIRLTEKMQRVQACILDIMNFIIKELKRLNKYLDLEELTVENAIGRKFYKQLQHQLDLVWHQLDSTTKQLVADLKLLCTFLTQLTQESSVSFYASITRLRTLEHAMKSSGWLILDSVEELFVHSKSRVYNNKNEFYPEPCPKWKALSEILKEIQMNTNEIVDKSEISNKVLVLTPNAKTCAQLKNYLTMGAGEYVLWEAMKCFKTSEFLKLSSGEKEQITTESPETVDDIVGEDSYVLMYTQQPVVESASMEEEPGYSQFQDCSQMADSDIGNSPGNEPILLIQSVKRNGDPMTLERTLQKHTPSYVILYGADITAIRQLEVYQNNHPTVPLTIYFIIYGGSVEEQGYLTSLRREKEIFEKLINIKQTMIIPSDQDGKSGDNLNVSTECKDSSSRKGEGESTNAITPKVIVDIREFRSELPNLLHKRGIDIEPVTILVGDYILTPEICVERKSISDLIMSLNSGRLYHQAVSMSRYYAKPMLLIEFDQNKSFCLEGNYYMTKDVQSVEITAKLQLLTLYFPKLKLVWSPNPPATAQLFQELKEGRAQPDAQIARQIGAEADVEEKNYMRERFNIKIQDFIAKLPGIYSRNLRVILNNGVSLDHLITLSEEELTKIIGNSTDAQMFYRALHEKFIPPETGVVTRMTRAATKIKNKGLFPSKKKEGK